MQNVIMLAVLLLVIATSVGVFFWFTRRLNKIEEELWGEKRREAEAVAKQEAAAEAEKESAEATE